MLRMPFWTPQAFRLGLAFAVLLMPGLVTASCSEPASPSEFLDCASRNDPQVQAAQAELEVQRGQTRFAGRWQDPDLSGEFLSHPGGGSTLSTAWMQAVPLGSAKGHSAREAALRAQAMELRLERLRAERKAEWVVSLARLRQIEEELALLAQQESLGDKAQERLSRLAFRTAEQEAAAHTFRWNRQALAISRQELESERGELRLDLAAALGAQPAHWDFAVPHRESWPSLPALDWSAAPELKALRLEVLAGEESLKKADAGAWPGLSLGPVLEDERGPEGGNLSIGGALSLELPLWNRNSAERSAARVQRDMSSRMLGLREQALRQRLDALQARYQAASAVVARNAHALEDGAPKLSSINKAYLAGRLPVSAALEAFRQYFDAIEKNHALEREALSSLWRFHALMGLPVETKP